MIARHATGSVNEGVPCLKVLGVILEDGSDSSLWIANDSGLASGLLLLELLATSDDSNLCVRLGRFCEEVDEETNDDDWVPDVCVRGENSHPSAFAN